MTAAYPPEHHLLRDLRLSFDHDTDGHTSRAWMPVVRELCTDVGHARAGALATLVDVIGGQVALMFDQVSTSTPQIRAGKVRPLAVTSLKRSPLLPDVPTVDESGVAGYEDVTFNGLVAPAGTPREILVRLNRAVAAAVSETDLYGRFIERGIELKASASPEEFGAYIKTEAEKKARLAREAGIKAE